MSAPLPAEPAYLILPLGSTCTTALRWIGKLTAADLLHRHPDPQDRRRAFVSLSPAARDAMYRYVAALADAKLPLV